MPFVFYSCFSQTESMQVEGRPYNKCTGRQVKYPPLVPLKLRHHKISQMAWDKWHGGSYLHHFKAGQQIWKVFFCTNTNHMWDLRGPSQTSKCLRAERCEKLREVNVLFCFRCCPDYRLFRRSHLGCALRAQVVMSRDSRRNPTSKPPLKLKTLRVELWVIPFSETLSLDEYGTPEQLWLKVKMNPDGIYVTECEGGRCSVTPAWSNKGQGGRKKMAGCEKEPSRSQQVAAVVAPDPLQLLGISKWTEDLSSTWELSCTILSPRRDIGLVPLCSPTACTAVCEIHIQSLHNPSRF